MRLSIGSCRLVIVGKKYVYKIPYRLRSIKANRVEYQNALDNDYVAKTERKWYGLRQERLTDLVTLPYKYDGPIQPEWEPLWHLQKHCRFQVGKSADGQWKFFDYEDVKFYADKNRKIQNHLSPSRNR